MADHALHEFGVRSGVRERSIPHAGVRSDGFAFLTRATRLHQGRLAARRAWDDLWGGRLPAGTTRTPNDDDANEEHKTEG
jgi:hypothetical protein